MPACFASTQQHSQSFVITTEPLGFVLTKEVNVFLLRVIWRLILSSSAESEKLVYPQTRTIAIRLKKCPIERGKNSARHGFQRFWHISINVPSYLYKCPPFSCPIQYSLSHFPWSVIDWHVCIEACNVHFTDEKMTNCDEISPSRLKVADIGNCITYFRTYFLSGLWFPQRMLFLHLKHYSKETDEIFCWRRRPIVQKCSKTDYKLLTWTITFMFPVTIIQFLSFSDTHLSSK